MISVDTKKKEWVGDFKNPGRMLAARQPGTVLDHDFPSWAIGRAIPYGIYDLAYNDGFVVVGHVARDADVRGGGHPPLVAGGRPPALSRERAVADRGGRGRGQRLPQVGVEGGACRGWRTSSA